ncbi:hypothetical protein L0Z64_16475 [Phaeobacter sp. BS23]|uniref:hypothetical protein n=2 Tax=unclassified Phaeobacter TaxID=2621772 RepID=UPI0038637425
MMPLEILIAMVLVGIIVIAILLHLTGRSAPVLMTCETAAKAWARHDPDSRIHDAQPSTLGHAALIDTDNGLGLVWCFGADTIARPLAGCSLMDHPKGFRVRFSDFATPSVLLHLSDKEREGWRRRILAASATSQPLIATEQRDQTHA